MLIREFSIDDIPQIDRIRQASLPWHTASVETQRSWFRSERPEARALRLGAEIDGRIVSFAQGSLELTAPEPGTATGMVVTHPDFRCRGLASALYERLENHLRAIAARRVQLSALVEPEVLAAAVRYGFQLGATDRYSKVDPRDLPPIPTAPAGVTVSSAAEAGAEALYQVDNVAAQDEPGDIGFAGMPYADWLDRYWTTINRDVSMVALVDGAPAAVTLLDANVATGRAMSTGSSTLPAYRGRGLMKLLKSVSLRRAADLGITTAFTGNDELNKPMLAINEWLGYQFVTATRSVLKVL